MIDWINLALRDKFTFRFLIPLTKSKTAFEVIADNSVNKMAV